MFSQMRIMQKYSMPQSLVILFESRKISVESLRLYFDNSAGWKIMQSFNFKT